MMTSDPRFTPPHPPMQVIEPEEGEDEALEAVAQSLSHVASVMDQLTGQLTQLTDAFGQTRSRRQAEAEIGRLFVEAQTYVDHSLEEARDEAGHILAGARDEAGRIVAAARTEADRIVAEANARADAIVAEARRSAILNPEAVTRLTSTIEGFARMNTELTEELTLLRSSLQPEPVAVATEPVVSLSPPVIVEPDVTLDPSSAPDDSTRRPDRLETQSGATVEAPPTAIPGVYEPTPTYPPPVA
jgi:hypothetical protein